MLVLCRSVALERSAAVSAGVRGRSIGPGVLLAAGRGQQGCDRDTGDEFSHCRPFFLHLELRASGLVCLALIRRGPAVRGCRLVRGCTARDDRFAILLTIGASVARCAGGGGSAQARPLEEGGAAP